MEEVNHQGFTELEVWKKARIFKNEIKELVGTFPIEEKFRLIDQLIRCSRGINAVIAEGYGRYTFKDQLHFCIIARGSLYESLNHLIDAFDCKYIDDAKLVYFKKMIDEVAKLLNGYINYLRRNLKK
ncbi:MAG: four helix bundle protein [Chitinophagaceae bacterium]